MKPKLDNPWAEDNANPWAEDNSGGGDKPGPVIAEWYEEDPGDKPKYLGDLPPQVPGQIVTNPETGKKEWSEDQGKVKAVFTDPKTGEVTGTSTATELRRAHKDTARLAKQAYAGGVIQGATFGFGDELAGLAEKATGGTYAGGRDERRKEFQEAEAGDPKMFARGRLTGGSSTMLIPGVGAAGAGKPLLSLRNVGIGAGFGGLSAAGESEADLTKGEFGPFAKDVGKGAAAGAGITAGLGLAGRGLRKAGLWVAGAPERVATKADDELWQLISSGAGKAEREAMAGALGSDRAAILDMARSNPAFLDALKRGDRKAAAEMVLAAQPEVESRLAGEVAGMEAKGGKTGQKIVGQPILKAMEEQRDRLRASPTPENLKLANEWQKRIDAYSEGVFPPAKVPDLKGEALASRLVAHGDSGTRERAAVNGSDFGKVAEKYQLGKDVDDVAARTKRIDSGLEALNAKTAEIYDKAAKGSGIYVANVTGKLREWADELRGAPMASGQRDAAAIDKLAADIAESEAANGRTVYTPKQLRAEITRIQDKAFAGSYSDPTEARAMGRELAGRLRGILDEHVAKNASPATTERLHKYNREISTLLAFKDSAETESAKLFEGLHKAPAAVIAPPETRTGRQTVADLYRMIQETKDPEVKQLLTDQLYRQIGAPNAQRLQAVEREKDLLGRLGETVKSGSEYQAGDNLRGKRLGKLLGSVNLVSSWVSQGGRSALDKVERFAAAAETLRRQGATGAHLSMAAKTIGIPMNVAEEALRMLGPVATHERHLLPKEAGGKTPSKRKEEGDLNAWKKYLREEQR